jgi:hypothetical protein
MSAKGGDMLMELMKQFFLLFCEYMGQTLSLYISILLIYI